VKLRKEETRQRSRKKNQRGNLAEDCSKTKRGGKSPQTNAREKKKQHVGWPELNGQGKGKTDQREGKEENGGSDPFSERV